MALFDRPSEPFGFADHRPSFDRDEVREGLLCSIQALVAELLGPPNKHLSNAREWRWGNKGALAIAMSGRKAGLWHDHATDEGGDLFDLIRREHGFAGFRDTIEWAAGWLGISGDEAQRRQAPPRRPQVDAAAAEAEAREEQRKKIADALAIWDASRPVIGSPAETYLTKARGVQIPPLVLAADVLRFHPACPRGSTERLPAMVALMRDIETNEPCAIHRTFLRSDGLGKVRDGKDKMMFGRAGGAAIKLVADEHVTDGLGIAEGIENALTALTAGWNPVWALGSAGAIRRFPALSGVEALTIFADPDGKGSGEGMKAANACMTTWTEAGAEVRIIAPEDAALDLNDVWREVLRGAA